MFLPGSARVPETDAEALTQSVACSGGRKPAREKNKTLWGSGERENERAFGFQIQVARFLEAGNRHRPGILGPSQWAMADDSFSSVILWFYGLARTLRIEQLVQLLHFIDGSPEL